MKYVITKSQYSLLVEDDYMQKLKRRISYENLQKYINKAEGEFPNPCDDFSDEFEYADNVITYAVEDLFNDNEWFYANDDYEEIYDIVFNLCKDWFGDYFLEVYMSTCEEEEDDDEDFMFEQANIEINRVIIKLFHMLDAEKKQSKTKKELLEVIKKYAPYFNIPSGFELYILELYLLNYRKDGDYSNLTKDNFVDPRDMKGKVTPNTKADLYTKAQLPFKGSNLEGFWRTRGGKKYYVVQSYGWYPVFIFRDGIWYENVDRYSSSTSKQMYRSQPYSYNNDLDSKVYLLTRDEMDMIENGYSHDEVMKSKREKLKKIEPELKSKRTSIQRTWGGWGNPEPNVNIKFKIGSVEEEGDKSIVNVDIYDVVKRIDGKSVPTPENYLKGEIPNITAEKIENNLKSRLRTDFLKYLGPKFNKMEDQNIEFRFNHLKK